MDTLECISTKLDVREFNPVKVTTEVKLKVLEAGRLTGSGSNSQHWHFILIQDKDDLIRLAKDAPHGKWLENAGFAIIILTEPKKGFHMIDAGRALQDMMLAAWNHGVISCVTTSLDEASLRIDFNIPPSLFPSAIVGFGYPRRTVMGKKNRKPLEEIVSLGRYGINFNPKKL
jgi:nitroreductase